MTALEKFNLTLILVITFALGIVIGDRGAIHGMGQRCAKVVML